MYTLLQRSAHILKIVAFSLLFLFSFGTIAFGQNNLIQDTGFCSVVPTPFQYTIKNAWTSNTAKAIDTRHTPMVGDIDGDGLTEVFASSYTESKIYIFDGSTGNSIGSISCDGITHSWVNGLLICKLKIANEEKGCVLIAGTNGTQYLYAISSAKGVRPITFTLIWQQQKIPSSPLSNMPVAADLDGDGLIEFVISNEIRDAVSGTLLDSLDIIPYDNNFSTFPLIVDLDGDKKPEIVSGTNVYKFDRSASPRVSLWRSCPGIGATKGVNMAADINQDGDVDLVFSDGRTTTCNVRVWTPLTSTLIGNFSFATANAVSYPFIGDIDGVEDGGGKKYPEIVLNTQYKLTAFQYNGSNTFSPKWTLDHTDASGATILTLFDFDYDGVVELVYRDETFLRIFDGRGAMPIVKDSFLCGSATIVETPVIADVLGDGSANIIVTGGLTTGTIRGEVMVFGGKDSPWASAPNVWNQQLYSPLLVNLDLSIPKTVEMPSLSFSDCNSNKVQLYNGGPMQAPFINKNTFCAIEPALDLYIESGSLTLASNQVTVTLVIGNQGTKDASKSIPIRFYKDLIDSLNIIAIDSLHVNLGPGQTTILTKTISLIGVQPSQFFVRLLDDGISFPAAGPYRDCDLTNNTKAFGTLELTKTVDTTTGFYQSVRTFTIKVTNNKPSTYNSIVVVDSLGSEWAYLSHRISSGTSTGSFDPTSRKLTWTIPSLDPGKSVELVLVAKASSIGTLRNTSWIKSINSIDIEQENKEAYVVTSYKPLHLVDDSLMIFQGSTNNPISIFANDTLPCPISELQLEIARPPQKGSIQYANEKLIYTPFAGAVGSDTLEYRILDCHPIPQIDTAKVILLIVNKPDNIVEPSDCYIPMQEIEFKVKQQWSTQGGNQYTSPLVGDLDGDGVSEVVVLNEDLAGISVLNGLTGASKTSLTIPSVAGSNGFCPAMVAVLVDADRNGLGEIIIAKSDKTIMSYEIDTTGGTFKLNQKWASPASFENPITVDKLPQPLVMDFNGDSIPELLIYNKIYNAVTGAYLGETEPITTAYVGRIPQRMGNKASNFEAVADMDGDGLPEVIAGGKVYKVDVNNTKDSVKCNVLFKTLLIGDGFTAVADVDLDGNLDVVVANVLSSTQTWLHVWSPKTNSIIDQFLIYTTTSNHPSQSFPFIGDIDGKTDTITGKKYPEICLTVSNASYTTGGQVQAYSYSTATKKYANKWTLTTSDRSGSTGITLFDFNNDGVNEIVYRDETHLRILNGTLDGVQPTLADSAASFPCISGTAMEYPVIADVNGDGSANICVTCGTASVFVPNYVRLYSSGSQPWAPARKVWNQVNYEPTMINNNLTVPPYPMPKNTPFNGQYPYNGALMQVPIMNFELEPVVDAADAAVQNAWIELKNTDTARVGITIQNRGLKYTNSSLPVALYNKPSFGSPALLVKPVNIGLAPNQSVTLYFDFHISELRSQMSLRIQDDGTYFPALGSYIDCNLDNNDTVLHFLLAQNDYSQVFSEKKYTLDILNNDYTASCSQSEVIIRILNIAQNGTASLSSDKKLEYTANANYEGAEKIQYEIECNGGRDTAWVMLGVVKLPDNISDAECFIPPIKDTFLIRKLPGYDNNIKDLYQYFSPMAGDVDNDDETEIVCFYFSGTRAYYGKNIGIFDGKNGALKSSISTPYCYQGVSPVLMSYQDTSYIIVATGGTLSISSGQSLNTAAEAFKLMSYQYNGTTQSWDRKWVSDSSYKFYNTYPNRSANISPMAADINGDGIPEIIMRGDIYNGITGKLLARLPDEVPLHGFAVSVADMLGRGDQQLVIGGRIYSLTLSQTNSFNPNAYKLERSAPPSSLPMNKHTALADFNLDGHLDVLMLGPREAPLESTTIVYGIWDVHNNRYLGRPYETPLLSLPGGWTVGTSLPFIGDVNNDGVPEFVFMYYNKLTCFRYEKSTDSIEKYWEYNVADQSGSTGITLFDFNQDGKAELVYRDEQQLWLLDGSQRNNCRSLSRFTGIGSGTGVEYPIVADVNGDGSAEIITIGRVGGITDGGELFVLGPLQNKSWAPARKVWNQYAYQAINVNNDLSIPRYPLSPATLFAGDDEVLGTADDVRPYNAFLQQQTNLNINGTPLFTTPDYVLLPNWTSKYGKGDSISLSFCVRNQGNEQGTAPLFVSVYKGSRAIENLLVVDSFFVIPNVGDTACYQIHIPNFTPTGAAPIVLSVNDKGNGMIYNPECDTTNGYVTKPLFSAVTDYAQAISEIGTLMEIISNDFLGTCDSSTIGVQIIQPSSHASVNITADKKVKYTSYQGYEGIDSLQYEINCNGIKDTAWLFIVVIPLPKEISDADCFVPNAGSTWGIRQAGNLGETSVYFTPLIGDLDGDGKPEIVIPSKHGTVINTLPGMTNNHKLQYISIFRGTDRSRIDFSTKLPFYPIGPGMLAIARINLNGRDTGMIIVAEADLFLRAYNMKGDLIWKSDSNWSLNKSTYSVRTTTSVGIADMNGDGVPEVYAGNRIFNALTGKLLCKGNSNFGYLGYNELNVGFYESEMTAVADIMGDSKLELAAGSQVYEVDATLSNMKIVAQLDTIICIENPSLKVPKDGFTQLIDIDNDGKLEVLVECRIETSKHFIYIWSPHKKRVLAQKLLLNTDKIGVPFIGDIDGDAEKKPEILMIGSNISYTPANNGLYAFKYKEDSTLFSSFWKIAHTDNSGITGLTLFDFNQDGISEIVYRDETQLRIINGSKKSHKTYNDTNVVYNLASFNCTSGTGYEYPTIADIDGDGAAEILIAGGTTNIPINGNLQIFKSQAGTSWAPARKVWNQYAYTVVNVNNDLSIPRYPMKISTVFPGPDGLLGTADDVRPYNAFLQQQTNLNKFGTTLFTTPNYVLLEGWTSKDLSGDSVSITFCVTNIGDENGTPPLYVSAYKSSRTSTNLMATNSYPTVPAIGDTLCYTLNIKNFSTLGNNAIVLSVNDKGTGTLVIPECDSTDGYQSKTPLFAKKDYACSFVACDLTIPILSNDKLGSCTPATVQLDTLTGSGLKKGSVKINADKSFLYTPVTGAKGIDSVSYYLKCGKDSSATTVYILIHEPIDAEDCPSVTTTVGFNPQTDVLYTWYTQQTGGTAIATGNPSNTLTVLKGSALDIGTLWVQPSYKGVIFPRIRISLTF